MNLSVSKETGSVPVTILRVEGELDGQNYQDLINKAKELYGAGARDLLLDLSGLTYISSAGLVALHSVALLLRGENLPDTEQGWSAYRSMGTSRPTGPQQHVKLLSPREEVKSVLEMVGFDRAFEVFTDLDQAVKSF